MAEIIENKKDFEEKALKSEKPVLVDFFAQWCPPCRALIPIIDKLSETQKDKVLIVKVDIDQAPELAEEYDIATVPTLILFKNGKAARTIHGALAESELLKFINQ